MISTLSSLLDAGVEMIEMNEKFEIRGVNHIAMVCADMARTVRFYRDVLGMQLVKTLDIPGGGQHFFFDIGNDDCLAFFWFPGAPAPQPGVARRRRDAWSRQPCLCPRLNESSRIRRSTRTI